METAQAQAPTLGQAYAEVERIVAEFERDGQAGRARSALERVALSLPQDVRSTLAEIHDLNEEGKRLDALIASRQRQRDDLVFRHRQAGRQARAGRSGGQG